jgi:glucosamine-6-phosphate deaminase
VTSGPESTGLCVDVLPSSEAIADAVIVELESAIAGRDGAVIGFATGGTFRELFTKLTAAIEDRRIDLSRCFATHLDEYLDYTPDRSGGMVHELFTLCPPLGALYEVGRFWPVPCTDDDAALRAHADRIAAHGGVDLQLCGIGRNSHLAFNEPGTPFDLGFHRARLADTTRDDARAQFAPEDPPRDAITSGVGTILAARRVVLAASGGAKAAAVRAMLDGPIDPSCPASAVRNHASVRVLLDAAAAS